MGILFFKISSNCRYLLNVEFPFGYQVRGDFPYQKCKVALEAVEFLDCGPEGDVGSYFADIVAQMAQDVSSCTKLFDGVLVWFAL